MERYQKHEQVLSLFSRRDLGPRVRRLESRQNKIMSTVWMKHGKEVGRKFAYRGSDCKYQFVPCFSISIAILSSIVGYNQVTVSSLGKAQEKTGTRGT
jgi:hypothetical protein